MIEECVVLGGYVVLRVYVVLGGHWFGLSLNKVEELLIFSFIFWHPICL